jgi:PAP2 superfamily
MKNLIKLSPVLALFAGSFATAAWANEVTDWNAIMFRTALVPPATNPLAMGRYAAIVQAAVFDAVNGIERRYTPIHVQPAAARGASSRAAAVQAAYATLVNLYPSQQSTLDAERSISLSGISNGEGHSESIARGIEWGQKVADAILAWRSNDGLPVPFTNGTLPGEWRPTPPGFVPFFGLQFVQMTPWSINSPSQFRPLGPPALTSAQYTTDFNETKTMGSASSASRTADQTLFSKFWNASTASYDWDTIAVSLAKERHLSLSKTARLMALVNISMADAGIGCWDAKYAYHFWRPITAIQLANTDGNPNTAVDISWDALLITPPHPDYPSGHSCVSGAAGRVLANYFGENTEISLGSDIPAMAGVFRFFPNFTAALNEIKNARIYGGIHFRSACDDGQGLGINVADYVMGHSLVRLHGNNEDGKDHGDEDSQ